MRISEYKWNYSFRSDRPETCCSGLKDCCRVGAGETDSIRLVKLSMSNLAHVAQELNVEECKEAAHC